MIRAESSLEIDERAVAIYHCVHEHEGFDETAQALFELVQRAERQGPGRKRCLYLDIDGHRNSQGGFDADMMEIQAGFLPEVLLRHVSEFSTPLGRCANPEPQDNDIPATLIIRDE